MSSPLSLTRLIRDTSPERHARATTALQDGSLTVHLTHQDDDVIRAIVTHSGKQYGVSITEHSAFCGCPDFSWKGVTCKHQTATALFALGEQHAVEAPVSAPVSHLMWRDGNICCGEPYPEDYWIWPWTDAMITWPEACPACVGIYRSGYNRHLAMQAAA